MPFTKTWNQLNAKTTPTKPLINWFARGHVTATLGVTSFCWLYILKTRILGMVSDGQNTDPRSMDYPIGRP